MVLFQFYGGYRGGYGGGVFSNFMYWLEYWGVRDIILPFILIFTIFYAVLQRIQLFGEGSKRYNVAISLAIALLVVIPHATGTYPPSADVVNIINDSIPEVALLVIVVVLLMMMLGLGLGRAYGIAITGWIALAAAAILVLIFISGITPLPILSYIDPSIQALIIILLVFGIIVWFVTREPGPEEKTFLQRMTEEITKAPEKKPK
jgi:hypothetical protein